MKLFICDKGWMGAAVVVCETREEAIAKITEKLASGDRDYPWSDYAMSNIESDLEEYEIGDVTLTAGE